MNTPIKALLSSALPLFATFRFEIKARLLSVLGLYRLRKKVTLSQPIRIEIGAGEASRKPGFITMDLNLTSDIPWDLRMGLPFPDGSLDFIYSEHVLEHFDNKSLSYLLSEAHRTLKEGGIFSAAVPDTQIWIDAYNNPSNFDKKEFCQVEFGLNYFSEIDFLNYIFYMDGQHRNMFDKKGLVRTLRNVGFSSATVRNHDEKLDSASRRSTSFYVEAIK